MIMVLIGELEDISELFSASCKLQSVADGLQKIIYQQKVGEDETKNLEWAGNLIGQLDFNSKYYSKEHPELCVIATKLRPLFYRTLLKLKIPLKTKFSEGIYETLKSYGRKVNLSGEELGQTCQIFKSLARDTLTELQCSYGLMGNI